jgi:hypothetical protein
LLGLLRTLAASWQGCHISISNNLLSSTIPDNMEQTTAKLRKTFRYPTDNDSDDSLPEAMDEEGSSTP